MQKNICFIENYRDFSFISKVDTNNTLFVPLNLERHLYFVKREIMKFLILKKIF